MRAAHLREAAASAPQYERRRPEQTPLYRLVREHYETFAAEVAGLPQFVKDEFASYLACGILANGFLRLTCEGCARDTLVAFSCKRRGICPSCGTRRMAETAAYLADHIIPRVPVRQWVLSFPIPLRSLFAVHPALITPVLRMVHRAINSHLIKQAGIERRHAATGAVTLIQRFGSAANLNIHLHALAFDGVYQTTDGSEGAPVFHAARVPTLALLQVLLDKMIKRILKLLTRLGHLIERTASSTWRARTALIRTTCSRRCKRPRPPGALRWGPERGAKCSPSWARTGAARRAGRVNCAPMPADSACTRACVVMRMTGGVSNNYAATSRARRSPTSV